MVKIIKFRLIKTEKMGKKNKMLVSLILQGLEGKKA